MLAMSTPSTMPVSTKSGQIADTWMSSAAHSSSSASVSPRIANFVAEYVASSGCP